MLGKDCVKHIFLLSLSLPYLTAFGMNSDVVGAIACKILHFDSNGKHRSTEHKNLLSILF